MGSTFVVPPNLPTVVDDGEHTVKNDPQRPTRAQSDLQRQTPTPCRASPRIAARRDASSDARPIGVLDSGIGGLSVWFEVVARLPRERTIYVADNANCPYGCRSAEAVIALSERLVKALLAADCKLIVVACNTATAAAIDTLRTRFDVPFVGMEPAVKPAALNSRTGVIGVLATEGTFNGRLFRETSARFATGVRHVVRVGEGLVELVESGRADTAEARAVVERQVQPMLAEGIDHLVLGCTHFPFLRAHIEAVAGPGVTLVDPAPAVARQVERLLAATGLLAGETHAGPQHRFAATGDPTVLRRMLRAAGWETQEAPAALSGLGSTREFVASPSVTA